MEDNITIKVEPRITDPDMLPQEKISRSTEIGSSFANAIKNTFTTATLYYIIIVTIIVMLGILAYNYWYSTPHDDTNNIPIQEPDKTGSSDKYTKEDLMKIYNKIQKVNNEPIPTSESDQNIVIHMQDNTIPTEENANHISGIFAINVIATENTNENNITIEEIDDNSNAVENKSIDLPDSTIVESTNNDTITDQPPNICGAILKTGKICQIKPKNNGKCSRHQL